MKYLKTIRKGAAVVVFLLFCFLFLDLHGKLPGSFASLVVFFQFIPSVLKSVSGLGWFTAGFAVVVVLSILGGRLYCSFLCPLGISIDLTERVTSKKQRRIRYTKPHTLFRYSVLILTVVAFFSGTMILINILDPYSIFARMITILVKPLVAILNNGFSRLLEIADIYSVSPYTQTSVSIPVVLFVLVFTIFVLVLAAKKGRLYCNTLCPVGTFLGLLSKQALFKLKINPDTCTGCGKCEKQCKSACINSKKKTIDYSRCVTCFNCIGSCSENSISYEVKPETGLNSQRRSFMLMSAVLVTGFSKVAFAVKGPVVYVRNKIKVRRKSPITPPGSVSIDNFTDKCTACYLCVSACPGKVIQPHFRTFDNNGLLMPAMLNTHGYCNFNCVRCSQVCPTGAILPINEEEKKQVQIGQVVFIRDNCIVITQKTECGACSEHCPTKAVFLIVENNLRLPKVNPDICVGCGACEYACPAIPYKAIYVEGNEVHLIAEKPVVKKQEQAESVNEFPF